MDNEENAIHPYNLALATQRFQRDYIHNVLELANWDLAAAAKMLEIGLNDLKQRVALYWSSE